MKASGFEKMARERLVITGIAVVIAACMLSIGVNAATPERATAAAGAETIPTYTPPPEYFPKAPGALNILIAMADNSAEPVRSQLLSFPNVATVDVFNANAGTPTLSQLQSYDLVFTWTNNNYNNRVAMGDVLADYVNGGGKLVMSVFNFATNWGMGGRVITEGLSPFTAGSATNHYSWANLGSYDSSHPLMQGFTAASDVYRDWTVLQPGATLVASWNDGEEFIAVKGNIIGVNSYLGPFFQHTGDYTQLMENIVNYLWNDIDNWVDPEWNRALPITVTNPNAYDLTDYQVKVVVPYHRGMRLDYADLRFAETDGNEFLPHWMEKSSRASATFWVRLPLLPAGSQTTIVAYFDNPYAQSTSNGDATFQFFDDFAGTTVNTAKWGGNTGQFTITNGYLVGTNTAYSLRSLAGLSDPVALETRTKANTLAPNGQMTLGFWESTSNSIGILEHAAAPGYYYLHNSGAWLGAWQYNLAAWHNVRLGITSSNTGSISIVNDQGDKSQQNFNADVTNERITLGQRYDSLMPGQGYNQQWDWIFARNYVSNEPTTSAWGRPILFNGGFAAHWADWAWRQALDITVTSPNPTALENHQVKVVVPLRAGMQADFDDIRFTEGYGDGFLPYWLQQSTPASATYWVKVTYVPANGNLKLRAYFDNVVTHSASNGNEVFIFFDDFSGTELDTTKWMDNTGSTQFPVSGGYLRGTNNNLRIRSTLTFVGPTISETRTQGITVAPNGEQILGFWASNTDSIGLLAHGGVMYVRNNNGWPVSWGWNHASWLNAKVTINPGGTGSFYLINDLGSTYTYAFNNVVAAERVALGRRYDNVNYNQAYFQIWDWIFVRQYAAADPTFTVAAGSILQPIPDSNFKPGEGVEVQPVVMPGPSSHMPEPFIESSALFDNLSWVMVLVAVGGITVLLIGARMRRRD